jgi:hypothetical protein
MEIERNGGRLPSMLYLVTAGPRDGGIAGAGCHAGERARLVLGGASRRTPSRIVP